MKKCILFLAAILSADAYRSEYKKMPGHHKMQNILTPLPETYLNQSTLPSAFTWSNVNGTSFVTKSLNQHIPQYCGSCWAHGALSAFADRIKIARKAKGADINLSVQYILNCGGQVAGSCLGGDQLAVYQFISQTGYVPYDTCMPYLACSSDSPEGACPSGDWTCSAINTCRTCSTFTSSGGKCVGLSHFPNASIAEYGSVTGADQMKAEIFARGPLACGVNAEPILQYSGGIYTDGSQSTEINHVISVVGWGLDSASQTQYWIVRNSWGEYWGELGYFRIALGQNLLGIESDCAWATPAGWTEKNYPCYEDGSNCQ